MISSGMVTVSGSIAEKSSRLVAAGEPIEVRSVARFVSRGGEKLDGALDALGVSVVDRSVMDAGASTGGFVDCVLQRGARRVFAVDVGRNQLHERVRSDPRVVSIEGVNIREMDSSGMPFPCSLVLADLSFISLHKVLDNLFACASPEDGYTEPQLLLLVKPQFEVGRLEASRGRGVITDPDLHRSAVQGVVTAVESRGASVMGVVQSPIKGADGNIEFFVLASIPSVSLGCVT